MRHEQIEIGADGSAVLPCCGVRLKNPRLPINCNCRSDHAYLVELIDNCPHRGDPTGQKVGCGCLSMPKQDVFFCAVHGEAIRHKITKSEWDGIACIECEKPREKLSSR